MNRQELEKYILDIYGVKPEYPWIKYPTFTVFRHESNNKWFAVIMTIDKRKIGLKSGGLIDVVNLKYDAKLFRQCGSRKGYFQPTT